MAIVIGLVQAKGGVGRSTLATNLAGELARTSNVVLVDCDMPQGTALAWANIRQRINQSGRLSVDTAIGQRDLSEKISKYRNVADFIILDGPPHLADMTRAILLLANLCLVPISASAAELWATANLLLLIEEVREYRPVNARIVWTRFRAHTRLAQELSEMVSAGIPYTSLQSTLGYRVAYADALGQGCTAAELSDSHARHEVLSLVTEIKHVIGMLG